MIKIDIWGRENCGICKRFIDRVEKLGYSYIKHNIDKYIVLHDNWRLDRSVEILAAMHCFGNGYPPVVAIDDKFLTFAGALNLLKDVKDGKVK
jgi:hypothetical protein